MATITEQSLRDQYSRVPQYIKDRFGITWEDWVRRAESDGHTIVRESQQVQGPPGSQPDVISVGDQTVISGLPLFNQPLRNMLSSLFTNALAVASRDVSQGATGNQVLNQNPADIFGFLGKALENLGIPQGNRQGPPTDRRPPPDQPPAGGDGTPREQRTTSPASAPNPLDFSQFLPDLINAAPVARAQPALGNPPVMGGGESGSVLPQIFLDMMAGRASGAGGQPVQTASVGLGEIAALGQLGLGLGNMLFGGDEPSQEVSPQSPPFEPNFGSENSLEAFIRLFQLFGEGSGSPLGASPAQGYKARRPSMLGASVAQGAPADPMNMNFFQSLTTGGPAPSGGQTMASNPFTDIVGAFSLPSYQGPFSQQATPLQQQATDYASEFLRSSPMAQPGFGQDTLNELITSGGRFDLSPQFNALEAITNRRMQEGTAAINENLGAQGLRFGTDVARGQGQLTGELLAQEALQRAQIAQQSFENATNRRLQALGLAPQLTSQNLSNASQAFDIGEQMRRVGDTGIQRQMAEFARTQGAFFPLLLQFALAGTEGDTVVLGE